MNVAIDIDGTITAMPAVFAAMAKGLRASGHKVIIVTFRLEQYREETKKDLEQLGIEYDSLHMSSEDRPVDPLWKVEVALANDIQAFFEDAKDVLMALPKSIQPVWIVPPELRA